MYEHDGRVDAYARKRLLHEVLDTKGGRLPCVDELHYYCRVRRGEISPKTLTQVAQTIDGYKGSTIVLAGIITFSRLRFEYANKSLVLIVPAPKDVFACSSRLYSVRPGIKLDEVVAFMRDLLDALMERVPPKQLVPANSAD